MSIIHIRAATPDDVRTLLAFVLALAAFARMQNAVSAGEADLLQDGFGPTPRFEARLALLDGKPCGFGVFFTSYSTWEGRPGLFLEDIFVEDWARGHGVGRRLVADLAAIALERGYRRLDLSVLDWNPVWAFYERLGIRHAEGWLPYRASAAALAALAQASRGTTDE
jgi:GNAT superfamily N-acetyltransferase